jgi:hypothetical protein
MNRCLGTKRDNSPCTVTVEPPQTYCWWHDPANAQARKQAASRGGKRAGRGRPQTDLQDLKDKLITLADDVLEGRKDRGKAAVAGQLFNYAIGAIRTALKAREVEEVEERLEALEQLLQRENERNNYGA